MVVKMQDFFFLLTLSHRTIYRLSQIERVWRRQFYFFYENGRKFSKREPCSLRAISPLPKVFSKDLYCRHVKTRACVGKG